jgi:MFS transporter, PPP family, 3-phenylpropionic acid transporter
LIEFFYFFAFMVTATTMAFLPPYLRGLGLPGRQVSGVLAVTPLMAFVVPLGWAWLADRTKQHARVLQGLTLGACLCFLPVLFARRFVPLLACWVGYAFFQVGMPNLADSLAIARVRAGADYGRIRVWGSLGFMVAALATGAILAGRGVRGGDPVAPLVLWLALAAAFLAALRVRGTGEQSVRPQLGDLRGLLGDRRFRLLLIVTPLHWICCAPYNVYFGIFLSDLHMSPALWGLPFCIGVLAEMSVLLAMRRLHRHAGFEEMMAVSFLATGLRWLAVSQVHATWALMALQALHGLTFGLYWGAGIALIAESVPPALRATGQALFVMSTNLGTAIGNGATGALYDAYGPQSIFLAAAAAELVPLAVVLYARQRMRAASVAAAQPPAGMPS